MAEHKEYWETGDEQGNIKISEDVIASIASIAASDTQGVSGLNSGSLKGDLASILGKKNMGKGVKVQIGEKDDVELDICLTIRFGVCVADTARAVQENVKNSVESMTGLQVVGVNVCVAGVTFEEPAVESAEEK